MNVGTLTAKLDLLSDSFEKSLDDAGKKAWELGRKLTLGVTTPMAAAGGAALKFAQAQGSWAEELGNLSAATGLSTKRLQELKYVADQTGVSFDGITNTSLLLQRKLMGIEEGSGPASDAMAKLGVSIKDSQGQMRPMDEMLPEVLSKLRSMPNATERNAVAAQLFGRSLADVAPLLQMTEAEMQSMIKASHDSGKVMGDDTIKGLQDFDDKIGALQLRLAGFANQALGAFMALPGPIQAAAAAVAGLAMVAGPLIQIVVVLKSLRAVVVAASVAARLGSISFASLWAAITGPVAIVIAAIAAVAAAAYLIYRNWDGIKAFFVRLWDGVKIAFAAAGKFIKDLFAAVWEEIYNNSIGRMTSLFKWIWGQIKAVGRWFGIGAGPELPTPKAASSPAAGTVRTAANGGNRDDDIVAELKRINANTQKRAYA